VMTFCNPEGVRKEIGLNLGSLAILIDRGKYVRWGCRDRTRDYVGWG